ncbi:hypothetical protein N9B72_00850 [Bacteriovoracaceae bacterium]|nr:hypothetical protein [Bacteriovoracaceae bacterium]
MISKTTLGLGLVTLLSLGVTSGLASAATVDYNTDENELNIMRKTECGIIKKLIIKKKYPTDCYTNYQLFGKTNLYKESEAKKGIKIAGFNIWNLGFNQTRFKDLKVIAAMMDSWDLIGMVEIIPILGSKPGGDGYNNKNIDRLVLEIEELAEQGSLSTKDAKKLEALKLALSDAEKLYRAPGYIKLLDELRTRDSSWSLILSPRDLGVAGLREMTGYFFRAIKVRPQINEYCDDVKVKDEGVGYACVPTFNTAGIMKKDYRPVFSKRPFMASFKSADFDFTMLAIHTKFRSPKPELQKQILKLAYGVDNYKDVPGLRADNYYRFAETQTTLQFIHKLKQKYPSEKDIIFVGDFNLNGDEKYWDEAISRDIGAKLFIDIAKTSVSEYLIDTQSGKETHGRANNYDHFIFNDKNVTECDGKNAYVEDFYKNTYTARSILRKYVIRSTEQGSITNFDDQGNIVELVGYPLLSKKLYIMTRHLDRLEKSLIAKKMVNTKFKVVTDPIYVSKVTMDKYIKNIGAQVLSVLSDREVRIKYLVSELKRRVYTSQQTLKKYYAVYKESLSDHLPIVMSCKTSTGDDD